jgi:hypothetical protein
VISISGISGSAKALGGDDKDVKLGFATKPFSGIYATDTLPSMALDSGIHAGMTAMEPK